MSARTEMIGVRVEPDLLAALRRLAEERETSASSEARRAIKRLVNDGDPASRPGHREDSPVRATSNGSP